MGFSVCSPASAGREYSKPARKGEDKAREAPSVEDGKTTFSLRRPLCSQLVACMYQMELASTRIIATRTLSDGHSVVRRSVSSDTGVALRCSFAGDSVVAGHRKT